MSDIIKRQHLYVKQIQSGNWEPAMVPDDSGEVVLATDVYRIEQEIAALRAEVERLKGEAEVVVRKLVEAIEQLTAYQNGPPLATYTEGWEKGMTMCEAALSAAKRFMRDKA